MSNFQAPGNQPTSLSSSLGLSDPRLRRAAQSASLLEHQYGAGIHVDSKGRLAVDLKKLASNKVFITEIVRSFFSMTVQNTYEGDTVINEGDNVTNNWFEDNSVTNNYTFDVNDPDPNITLFFNGLITQWFAALPIGQQMTTVRQCIGFLQADGHDVEPPPWSVGDTPILTRLNELVDPPALDLGSPSGLEIIDKPDTATDIPFGPDDSTAYREYAFRGASKTGTINARFKNNSAEPDTSTGSRTWHNNICDVADMGLPDLNVYGGDYVTAGLWGLKTRPQRTGQSMSSDEGSVYAYLEFMDSSDGVIETVSLWNNAESIPALHSNIAFGLGSSSSQRQRWSGSGTDYVAISTSAWTWTTLLSGVADSDKGFRRRIPFGTHRIRTRYQMNSHSGSWSASEYTDYTINDTFFYVPVIIRS